MNNRINTPVLWTVGICWLAAPAAQGVAPPPLEAADDGVGADYNRVGDFKMPTSGVVGLEVAIRVTLNRMYTNDDDDGTPEFVELSCPVRTGNHCNYDFNVSCSVNEDCQPGGACEPNDCGPFSAFCIGALASFEGQVRYLGPPEAFRNNSSLNPKWVGAKLQCTSFVRDWSASALAAELGISESEADTIYYYGAEVVPCSIHAVQQATQSCLDSANESCFSDPLEVRTALWGDLWPPFNNNSFTDIGKQADAFKSIPFVPGDPPGGAPNKWRSMLREDEGNPGSDINFTDIGKTVDGFKSIAYREVGPTACP